MGHKESNQTNNDCNCFSYTGLIYPTHFLQHERMTVPEGARYIVESIKQVPTSTKHKRIAVNMKLTNITADE